jgi:hypothetical protein
MTKIMKGHANSTRWCAYGKSFDFTGMQDWNYIRDVGEYVMYDEEDNDYEEDEQEDDDLYISGSRSGSEDEDEDEGEKKAEAKVENQNECNLFTSINL